MSVLIETTLGDIVVDLYVKERPQTSKNFLKLCKMKYYNYCVFHSIQQNFIAQTGDPTGTGRGGDSVFSLLFGEQARYFEQENVPQLKHIKRGTLSMVNNGQDCNGSQFFFTLSENLDYLDGSHSVFGEVAEGWSALEKLNDVICDGNNRPYIDVRITHTIVLDDPFPNDKNLHIPSRSPSPSLELLKTARIGVDEDLDETQGKSAEEIREEMEDKEAKARAHVLEMVGDLHHAEEKPPDNVLFVCKLNSVTTEEDLEIIFSRFGKITCCEIIKDKITGNSLQYAFIEFEKPEHCENAYFKMDNVLIDDRRIHVDFSQSVSKNFQWNRQVSGTKRKENEKELVKKPNKEHKKKPSRSRSPQFAARKNFEEKKHHQYRTHEKPSEYRNARRRDSRSRSKTPPKRKHHKHKK